MLVLPVLTLLCVQQTLAAVAIVDIAAGQTKSVQVGESPMFQCTAPTGTQLEWVQNDSMFGEVILSGDPPKVITDVVMSGMQKSYLTVEQAEEGDSAEYVCRNQADPADRVAFNLLVSAGGAPPEDWMTPAIERQNANVNRFEVEVSKELRLKCVGGSLGSELVFERDGTVIVDDGRNTITVASNINSNEQVLILSHEAVAGSYTCRDDKYPGSASDTVTVVITTAPSVMVRITDPAGTSSKTVAGEPFMLKCEASSGTDLVWSHGDTLLEDELGGYFVNARSDVTTGLVISLLTKEESETADSGTYSCADDARPDQKDSIEVMVEAPERQSGGSSVPTEYRHVIMKVGTSVNLECSLEAPGQYRPEWSKDEVVICSGPKYSITMDTKPSSLVVKNTDHRDAGIYNCVFKHRDTGHIGGIIVFNVSALRCPRMQPPEFGSFDMCPSVPLHGDSCTFKCYPEFKLSNRKPLICEQQNGVTHWSGRMPSCKRIPLEELEAAMPTSLSHVLLQVGWDLELHCSHPATWNKNGARIRHGEKYHVKNGHLVIRTPDKLDAGIYDCFVRDSTTSHLKGIQKFNVTTLPCPRLYPPKNGSFVQCSSRPVYGETCIVRCNRGLKLTGNKARTCVLTALSHSNTQVHWTGGEPTCAGLYSTNMQYKSSASSRSVVTSSLVHWSAITAIILLVTH